VRIVGYFVTVVVLKRPSRNSARGAGPAVSNGGSSCGVLTRETDLWRVDGAITQPSQLIELIHENAGTGLRVERDIGSPLGARPGIQQDVLAAPPERLLDALQALRVLLCFSRLSVT
jgi:hypothetical protein